MPMLSGQTSSIDVAACYGGYVDTARLIELMSKGCQLLKMITVYLLSIVR